MILNIRSKQLPGFPLLSTIFVRKMFWNNLILYWPSDCLLSLFSAAASYLPFLHKVLFFLMIRLLLASRLEQADNGRARHILS